MSLPNKRCFYIPLLPWSTKNTFYCVPGTIVIRKRSKKLSVSIILPFLVPSNPSSVIIFTRWLPSISGSPKELFRRSQPFANIVGIICFTYSCRCVLFCLHFFKYCSFDIEYLRTVFDRLWSFNWLAQRSLAVEILTAGLLKECSKAFSAMILHPLTSLSGSKVLVESWTSCTPFSY